MRVSYKEGKRSWSSEKSVYPHPPPPSPLPPPAKKTITTNCMLNQYWRWRRLFCSLFKVNDTCPQWQIKDRVFPWFRERHCKCLLTWEHSPSKTTDHWGKRTKQKLAPKHYRMTCFRKYNKSITFARLSFFPPFFFFFISFSFPFFLLVLFVVTDEIACRSM